MLGFMKKFLDLFKGKKKDTKSSVSKPASDSKQKDNVVLPFSAKKTTSSINNQEEKQVIELLQKKIVERMKQDKAAPKKAAHIISEMINKKASGKD